MTPPGRSQSVASGAITAFVGQLASYGLAFAGTLLVSRALGPEGRGQMAVAITAATSFFAFAHLSVDLSATYFFARRRLDLRTIARVMTTLALMIAPIVLILQIGFLRMMHDSVFSGVETVPVLIAAASVPFAIHLVWLIVLFQLAERLIRSQSVSVATAAMQLVAVVVLTVTDRLNLTTALCLYAASITCAWLLHLWLVRGFLSAGPTRDRAAIRTVVGYALRLHPGYLFWFLLLRADILLVNALLGTRQAGLYSIAVIVAEMIMLMSAPIAVAILPVQSLHESAAAAALTFKAVRFNVFLAMCLAVGFALGMPLIIGPAFGSSFTPAYNAMLPLLPGVVAMAGYRPLYNWLLRQSRPGVTTVICGGAFAVNIALNLLLLPALGIVGAGVASSIAYAGLTCCFLIWGLRVSGLTLREALCPTRDDVESLRHFAQSVISRRR